MILSGKDPPSPTYSYIPCVCWGARTRDEVEVKHLEAEEYDRHIATRRGMAAAYLDPNLNHTAGSGAKSRLSMERSPGAMERVLKVYHYFESNNEPSSWVMNIRHGDATDVRGIIQKIVDSHKVKNVACFGIRLSHMHSEEVHWLHPDMGVSHVREKFEQHHPADEWR
ncbi:protein tyrosine kinase 2aa isoform X6 [Pristis pectinata]|nr:protein tyrosine kinase 2aa isoform X6 [Pristis pectinata]